MADDILLVMVNRAGVAEAPVNWGDVPTWVSASVTLMALIFAVVAVVVARRTYRLESERDRINAAARQKQDAFVRRSQAALVSAWWAKDEQNPARKGRHSWAVYLRNASNAPVYKAHLTVMGTGSRAERKARELPVVPPTHEPVIHTVELPGVKAGSDCDHRGLPLADYRVSLRFTDATGVRWMRDEYGYLKELAPNLLIWTSPEGGAVVGPFTAEFLATYGVTAEFDTRLIEAELEKHFIEALPGPDILIGPHDWVGKLVGHGLVEPVTLSEERRNSFAVEHLNAFSFGGKLYAVPSSLDTVALIRNTDLVPDAPKSIEQLLALAQDLRDRNVVPELMAVPVSPTGDSFHMWPIFTSAGGWLFKRGRDGIWDSSVQGINSPETVRAFEKIRFLGGLGVLRPEIDRLRSFDLFAERQTAFLVAASGAVVPLRKSGVNFAVSAVPPFEHGRPAVPFLSLNGFYIASRGQNMVVAGDLVPDYLTRGDVIESFGRLAHVVPIRLTNECDPAIAQFHKLCADAVPMPSFPQMRELWSLMNAAELALIAGEEATAVSRDLAVRLGALF